MRFARSFLALAALCTATACADAASSITAPTKPALTESAGGTWVGSGNATGGGWTGSGNVTDPGTSTTSADGDGVAEPADSTGDGRGGGWGGSGN